MHNPHVKNAISVSVNVEDMRKVLLVSNAQLPRFDKPLTRDTLLLVFFGTIQQQSFLYVNLIFTYLLGLSIVLALLIPFDYSKCDSSSRLEIACLNRFMNA